MYQLAAQLYGKLYFKGKRQCSGDKNPQKTKTKVSAALPTLRPIMIFCGMLPLKAIHFSHKVQSEARCLRHLLQPKPNLPSWSVSLQRLLNINFCGSVMSLKEMIFRLTRPQGRQWLLGPRQCLQTSLDFPSAIHTGVSPPFPHLHIHSL